MIQNIFIQYLKVCFALTILLLTIMALSASKILRSRSQFGVSFSPAGLMTPYHLGVSEALKELSIINSDCNLAGASGGALSAITSALALPVTERVQSAHSPANFNFKDTINSMLYKNSKESNGLKLEDAVKLTSLEASVYVAKKCRDFGPRGTLRIALEEILQELIPKDAHSLLKKRPASCGIAFTSIGAPQGFKSFCPTSFESREDLIECLIASCNIPFYFNGNSISVDVRGMKAIDGFFAVDFRRFGCPPTGATKREILVCPYSSPYVNLHPYDASPTVAGCEYDVITPAILKGDTKYWPFSFKEVLQMSFSCPVSSVDPSKPISDDEIRQIYNTLFKGGQESVYRWYEKSGKKNWK